MNRKDHLEKYYQKNGRFQNKKDKNSIGFCVISNYKEDIVISLTEKEISFEEALKAKNLPDPIIFMQACAKYKNALDIIDNCYLRYWVNIKTYCGIVDSDFGTIASHSSLSDISVGSVGYLNIDYYPDDNNYDYGSRLYREMWRIEK